MSSKKSSPPGPPPPLPSPPSSNPFAALAPLRDALPAGAPAKPAAPAPAPAAKPGPARAVVRFEKKGRGGKAVTVIEQLGLAPAALSDWARALKAALGTGGAVEDDTIVLQGDVRARIEPLLAARGVRKITIAS